MKITFSQKNIFILIAVGIFSLGAIYAATMNFTEIWKKDHESNTDTNIVEADETDILTGVFKTKAPEMDVVVLRQPNTEEAGHHIDNEGATINNEPKIFPYKIKNAHINEMQTVSRIMINFLRNQDYKKDLDSLSLNGLPKEVKDVFKELHHYAENIKNDFNAKIIIFPKKGILDRMFGRFVQISKIEGAERLQDEYQSISKKLHILEDYFYSTQFLNETNAHD